jgi:hypothetical protein
MATFLKTTTGDLINAAHVRRISEKRGRPVATMDDDDTVELYGHNIDAVQQLLMPIVAAAPGFMVVRCSLSEHFWGRERDISRAPVLAWRYDGRFATPVTADNWVERNLPCDPKNAALLCPDGRVIAPGGNFDDEATWIGHVEGEHETAKARKAAERPKE